MAPPDRTFVVLHAFAKRAPVTPERAIAIAAHRMVAYLEARRGPAKREDRHEA